MVSRHRRTPISDLPVKLAIGIGLDDPAGQVSRRLRFTTPRLQAARHNPVALAFFSMTIDAALIIESLADLRGVGIPFHRAVQR